jgi:sulfate adenylyltransferase subunit 1 (EFTu-like GTPase family)
MQPCALCLTCGSVVDSKSTFRSPAGGQQSATGTNWLACTRAGQTDLALLTDETQAERGEITIDVAYRCCTPPANSSLPTPWRTVHPQHGHAASNATATCGAG